MLGLSRKVFIGSGAAGVAALATLLPAQAITVTLNGSPVTLAPPPLERAGRVFVPLRGVFEQLGASVVYANGTINATGRNGNTIALRIGSNSASVNGATHMLDVAPFIVGASTYVPLRFVSEALGAGVNYDSANSIVALSMSGVSASSPVATPAPAATALSHLLRDVQPTGTVAGTRPTVSANFATAVDPNSLRLWLDGLEITSTATRSATGFVFAPPSPLQSMNHSLTVTGRLSDGRRFSDGFNFTTGNESATVPLRIYGLQDGSTVGMPFTVAGRTAPGARVHIAAGAAVNVARGFAFGTGSFAVDLVADDNGRFSQDVSMQAYSGADIGVTVTATDPSTKQSAEKKLHLKAQ